MYLATPHQKVLAELLNSALWLDVERCLMERRPPAAEPSDELHAAAAKGHIRAGFEACMAELKKLPKEGPPESPAAAFDRPAVMDTRD